MPLLDVTSSSASIVCLNSNVQTGKEVFLANRQ